jgi:hypothetical protein
MPPQGVLHGLERTHERGGVLLAVHPGEKLEGVAQALALLRRSWNSSTWELWSSLLAALRHLL